MYTQKQLAEYLGLKERTIEAWRSEGRGPDYIRISSHKGVRYTEEAVQRWLAQNTVHLNK